MNEEGMAYLLALDPGGTTGWAVVWLPPDNLLSRDIDLFDGMAYDLGQLSGPEVQQVSELREDMRTFPSGPLIIEDFILRQFRQDRSLLSPVRVTAMVEYMLETEGWSAAHPVRKQQASLAKSTATDDRLREWGLWEPGAPHARDALRHALTFLRRARGDARLRQWGWPDLFG